MLFVLEEDEAVQRHLHDIVDDGLAVEVLGILYTLYLRNTCVGHECNYVCIVYVLYAV